MYKIILFLACMMPVIYGAERSGTEFPTLQERALKKLIRHPGIIAQNYQTFALLYPDQQQLLLESIDRALRKRLGFSALIMTPDMPVLKTVLREHLYPVLSPNGKMLTCLLYNGRRYRDTFLRDAKTGELLNIFAQKEEPKLSSDGKLIVLAAGNRANGLLNDLYLYNNETKKLIGRFENERDPVFSPDGTVIATTVRDQPVIRVRNAATGELITTLDQMQDPVFSPDSTILAVTTVHQFVIGYCEQTHLYNSRTGHLIKTLEYTMSPIVFSPDGTILSLLGGDTFFRRMYYDTDFYDTGTWQLIRTLKREQCPAFNADGTVITTKTIFGKQTNESGYCTKKGICVRNAMTGRLLYEHKHEKRPAMSPDGNFLALPVPNAADYRIDDTHLYKIGTGQLICIFEQESGPTFSANSDVVALMYKTGSYYSNRHDIHLRKATTGELIGVFKNERDPVFSPDGTILISQANSRGTATNEATVIRRIKYHVNTAKITDPCEQRMLFAAAQAWLNSKAYTVDPNDPVYQNLLKQIPYLNNRLLFDESPALTDQSQQISL